MFSVKNKTKTMLDVISNNKLQVYFVVNFLDLIPKLSTIFMVYLQVNGNLFSVDCIFFVDPNCHLFINECDISSYYILLNCHAQHISTHIVIQMERSGRGGA